MKFPTKVITYVDAVTIKKGAKRLLKEFLNKGWCLSSVIKLLRKIDETGTVERKPGSGKKRTTRTVENVELVERLAAP